MTEADTIPPHSIDTRKGYLAAAVGTLLGSALLAGGGALAFLLPCDKNEELSCLGPALAGIFLALIGSIVGCVVGCYLGLRIRRHRKAGATAGMLVLLALVATGIGFAVGNMLAPNPPAGLGLLVFAGPVVLPLLARRIVIGAGQGTAVEI